MLQIVNIYKDIVYSKDNGKIFSWGVDISKCGILGLGELYACTEPKQIDISKKQKTNSNYKIYRFIQVSTGLTHAGAIDDSGKLYIWGCGQKQPQLQNFPEVTHCKLIKCGENATFTITVGGKAITITNKKMVKQLTHVKDYKINTFFKEIQILPFGSVAMNEYGDVFIINSNFKGIRLKLVDSLEIISEIQVSTQNLSLITKSNRILIWKLENLKKTQFFENPEVFSKINNSNELTLPDPQKIDLNFLEIISVNKSNHFNQFIFLNVKKSNSQLPTSYQSLTEISEKSKDTINILKNKLFENWSEEGVKNQQSPIQLQQQQETLEQTGVKNIFERISIIQKNLNIEKSPIQKQEQPTQIEIHQLPSIHTKNLSLFTLAEENSDEHSSNNNTKEDIEHIYNMKRKQLQVKDLFEEILQPQESKVSKKIIQMKSNLMNICVKKQSPDQSFEEKSKSYLQLEKQEKIVILDTYNIEDKGQNQPKKEDQKAKSELDFIPIKEEPIPISIQDMSFLALQENSQLQISSQDELNGSKDQSFMKKKTSFINFNDCLSKPKINSPSVEKDLLQDLINESQEKESIRNKINLDNLFDKKPVQNERKFSSKLAQCKLFTKESDVQKQNITEIQDNQLFQEENQQIKQKQQIEKEKEKENLCLKNQQQNSPIQQNKEMIQPPEIVKQSHAQCIPSEKKIEIDLSNKSQQQQSIQFSQSEEVKIVEEKPKRLISFIQKEEKLKQSTSPEIINEFNQQNLAVQKSVEMLQSEINENDTLNLLKQIKSEISLSFTQNKDRNERKQKFKQFQNNVKSEQQQDKKQQVKNEIINEVMGEQELNFVDLSQMKLEKKGNERVENYQVNEPIQDVKVSDSLLFKSSSPKDASSNNISQRLMNLVQKLNSTEHSSQHTEHSGQLDESNQSKSEEIKNEDANLHNQIQKSCEELFLNVKSLNNQKNEQKQKQTQKLTCDMTNIQSEENKFQQVQQTQMQQNKSVDDITQQIISKAFQSDQSIELQDQSQIHNSQEDLSNIFSIHGQQDCIQFISTFKEFNNNSNSSFQQGQNDLQIQVEKEKICVMEEFCVPESKDFVQAQNVQVANKSIINQTSISESIKPTRGKHFAKISLSDGKKQGCGQFTSRSELVLKKLFFRLDISVKLSKLEAIFTLKQFRKNMNNRSGQKENQTVGQQHKIIPISSNLQMCNRNFQKEKTNVQRFQTQGSQNQPNTNKPLTAIRRIQL